MSVPRQKPGLSKQDYRTPDLFIRAVKRFLNIDTFDFDFAADESNSQAPGYWDESLNALLQDVGKWQRRITDGWGWLNPPFADISPWAERCAEVNRQIAFLVPASVGSNWFRDYVDGKAMVLFLNGRLAFIDGKPAELYPKDCILCLYGMQPGYQVWNWRDDA